MTHAALLSRPLLRRAQRLRRNAASLPRHEYCGIVEEVGSDVTTIRPGQFIIGSFFASDNTCPHCRAGYQTSCQHREYVGAGGAQAEALHVPLADGTLVATPEVPDDGLLASLLAASDVLGTGWFAAVAAGVRPGSTVAVVGMAPSACSASCLRSSSELSGSSRSRREPRRRQRRTDHRRPRRNRGRRSRHPDPGSPLPGAPRTTDRPMRPGKATEDRSRQTPPVRTDSTHLRSRARPSGGARRP
jgi:alcohol dehydrogenase-like protein